ncbi:galactokinase [Croceivirga radicis]|uniref:Galactokinase n=1 Tax=Croceivirga radicis TaxID=1929488 RepID=A0A1V6LRA6_9FLAO|nr:galactokinase [Croceivirga radicis]OQD42723.1 galactokinase [Croceivirga radicis]
MGGENSLTIVSPGRINLIGEHVDYNDGFVLPAAIEQHIQFKICKNGTSNKAIVRSKGFEGVLEINLKAITPRPAGWENYLLGVINEMQQLTDGISGFDCEIQSFLPVGSGVSSSAALECGFAYAINELFDLGLDRWQIVKLSQRAEHNYVGTKCGIMDQFASVMGKKGFAMLLDCKSLEFDYVPANFDPYVLLLLNSNVTHDLATGAYNKRRQQCEDGLSFLVSKYGIAPSFRNVTLDMLTDSKSQLDATVFNRCSYVVEEIARVQMAKTLLKENKLKAFGELMYKTHEGLSDKYEVSCKELDFLVDLAKRENAVLGSRIMGGGFGGCTINLIHKDSVNLFIAKAAAAYKKEFGIELNAFETQPSNGTTLIKENHEVGL